jgi:putative methyltransferase
MSRQYLSAGKAVEAVIITGKSFKSYCANSSSKIGKVDYALAAETLKYSSILQGLFNKINLNVKELDLNIGVFYVMVYEILFGSHKINGGGVVKRIVLEYIDKIRESLDNEMKNKKISNYIDLLPKEVREAAAMFKYIRVNEIKLKIEDGLKEIKTIIPEAIIDKHIPSLVVLPPGIYLLIYLSIKLSIYLSKLISFGYFNIGSKSFGEHSFVKDARFIIQDKASCMPSQILYDVWSEMGMQGDFIDCCAAPGNKTSHLAALLYKKQNKINNNNNKKQTKNKSLIYAFDKNVMRTELLSKRMKNAGSDGIVQVNNQDFLSVDVLKEKYSQVRGILLDPSCSGSGVSRAMERVFERVKNSDETKKENEQEIQRLENLRSFQISALKHAMTFPNVRAITYSTCSIHEAENESVVSEVLSTFAPLGWELSHPSCLKSWHR